MHHFAAIVEATPIANCAARIIAQQAQRKECSNPIQQLAPTEWRSDGDYTVRFPACLPRLEHSARHGEAYETAALPLSYTGANAPRIARRRQHSEGEAARPIGAGAMRSFPPPHFVQAHRVLDALECAFAAIVKRHAR